LPPGRDRFEHIDPVVDARIHPNIVRRLLTRGLRFVCKTFFVRLPALLSLG
jgi:hypothetical protein